MYWKSTYRDLLSSHDKDEKKRRKGSVAVYKDIP